jgi:hypothetical protein
LRSVHPLNSKTPLRANSRGKCPSARRGKIEGEGNQGREEEEEEEEPKRSVRERRRKRALL